MRTKVKEGTVAIVLNTEINSCNETVYVPGQEFFQGETVIVRVLSYEDAFKALMELRPCELKRLLEQSRIVHNSLKA